MGSVAAQDSVELARLRPDPGNRGPSFPSAIRPHSAAIGNGPPGKEQNSATSRIATKIMERL